MCGIAGLFQTGGKPIDPIELKGLSDSLSHRGPDDLGYLGWSPGSTKPKITRDLGQITGSTMTFVHRRLSIIDLTEGGWQPMASHNQRYFITYNGEIYNYVELRSELEGLGHQFHSQSDTEVLLAGFQQWGHSVLRKLNGMFAFAVLDIQDRKLFLARDPFGIKPLYYSLTKDRLAFASELKALLPFTDRRLNAQKTYDYLRFNLTDQNSDTFLTEISQVPAAHFMEIPLDRYSDVEVRPYWRLDLSHKSELSFSAATEKLRELFLENIRLHMRSDVPVGAALSGGIDSSAVVMSMRHLYPKADIHTFSYIADDDALNEEKWINQIVSFAGCIGHKIYPQAHDLLNDIDELITSQDSPFGSTSIFAQHRVFQSAKKAGIKVMLDGQGADELFAGYLPMISARLASLIRQGKLIEAQKLLRSLPANSTLKRLGSLSEALGLLIPQKAQPLFRSMVGRGLYPAWLNRQWFMDRNVASRPLWQSQNPDILKEKLYQTLIESSLPMLLRYEDRNSMRHSIESRVPFLTTDFVNFVFSLPEEYLISSEGLTKSVFRSAMQGIVPQEILSRRDKIGFATPEKKWLRLLGPWVDEVLSSKAAEDLGVLDLTVARREWKQIIAGQKNFDFRIWRWVNLIKWVEQFQVKVS